MAYQLRPGVSFCVVAERSIFLDVPGDRYFALATDADTAFLKLVRGEALTAADEVALDRVAETGPLERINGDQPALAAPAAPPIAGSLIDPVVGRASVVETILALWHLKSAARRLRWMGLADALRGFSRRKRSARRLPQERAERVAAAFSAASAYSTALDQCLPRSLAAADRLATLGGSPDLIIGVKLQPFQAHCWTQCDGQLVNERSEVTQVFTPILVL